MSIFSFPRLHVSGLIEINVGTGNNDDYSGLVFADDPGKGQPVRLADSAAVRPTTFGLSDADFVTWVQKVVGAVQPSPQAAAAPPATSAPPNVTKGLLTTAPAAPAPAAPQVTNLLPAEWNYYGDMGLTMRSVTVNAVDYTHRSVVAGDPNAGADPFIGATLSFNNRPDDTGRSTGIICDVTPEDVPLSQILAGTLMLARDGNALFAGQPHKAVTRWINFQRNVNLTASAGASAVFQHALPLSALAGQPILQYLPRDADGRALAGLVFRYVLYRTMPPINPSQFGGDMDKYNQALIALYAKGGTNPGIAQISGTIAPWFEGEMATVPAGRFLVATATTITPPPNTQGNGPAFSLAPATLIIDNARPGGPFAVLDTAGSFPEWYTGNFDPTVQSDNAKLDFGALRLILHGAHSVYDLGPIPYADAAQYAAHDGIFDFSLAHVPAAEVAAGSFAISGAGGAYLSEQEYFIASDQAGVYSEQDVTGSSASVNRFNNEGDSVPVTFRVFRRGVELTPTSAPTLKLAVWEYDTTPNQAPGPRTRILPDLAPGEPLTIVPGTPGNRVYTVTLPGAPPAPKGYGNVALMTAPLVCMRILPNDRDYSTYYDASQPEPVGTVALTFQVLYDEVLRNYYLLYPAMNQRIALNDPSQWADPVMAGRMLQRTQFSWWMQPEYMPRTRDLSSSRRGLIQAWCRKIIGGAAVLALLLTHPAGAQSRSAPAAAVPFHLVVQAAEKQPAPALQAFSLGESTGLWLIVGGRRNGFHRTSDRESTFPSSFANDSVFVVDRVLGRRWSMPLPPALRLQLRTSNSASTQDGGILYIVGGYGSTCDSDQRTCYQTFPTLTAVNVRGAISAVRSQRADLLQNQFATLSDERMRVAGGGLRKLGPDFYLAFGQNYDSVYKGAYTGKYTGEVRQFRVSLAGTISGGSGPSTIAITRYAAFGDPAGAGGSSEYHRRDLNVVESVRPGGRAALTVYGGVFTPNGGAWVHPILIDDGSGAPRIRVDSTFSQKMSAYDCARALMYDPRSRIMYASLFGGISLFYYDIAGMLVESSVDNFMPFVSSITSIAHRPDGTTVEVPQPPNMSLPKLLGANAEFIPLPGLPRMRGTREVLDLSRIPAGPRVLVGQLYGGIVATAPQASEFNPTFASGTIYDVYLVRTPDPSARKR
jgi:hypothetical protein